MTEDFLGLRDDEEIKAAIGPALVVAASVLDNELHAMEEAHRRGSTLTGGQSLVMFTRREEDGIEIFDTIEEGQRWKIMMAWPTVPSPDDAMAFAISIRATMTADAWELIR